MAFINVPTEPQSTPYDALQQLMEKILGKAPPPSKWDAPPYKYPERPGLFSRDLPPEPEPNGLKDFVNTIVSSMSGPENFGMVGPMTGGPALIKGGRISSGLVPKAAPGAAEVGAQRHGSVKAIGPSVPLELFGEKLTETPARWGRTLQTFYPDDSPSDMLAFAFNNPPKAGLNKPTLHFGDFHARRVRTNKPLSFWEEIQSEAIHDKPPTEAQRIAEAGTSRERTPVPPTLDGNGMPNTVTPPWAPNDDIITGTQYITDSQTYMDRVVYDQFEHGYSRTSQSSFYRRGYDRNVRGQLDQETLRKLNELPPWVRASAEQAAAVYENGGTLPNKADAADIFFQAFEADTTMPADKRLALLDMIKPVSQAAFNWQPTNLTLTRDVIQEMVKPANRVKWYVNEMHNYWSRLMGRPVSESTTSVVPPPPNMSQTYPAFSRENQSELAIKRTMANADAENSVWTMANEAGILMRDGQPFSYAYDASNKSPSSAVNRFRQTGENKLVPEMLRITTDDLRRANNSLGPRELRRRLDESISGPIIPSEPTARILRDGGDVKIVRPMGWANEIAAYDIPVFTRQKDIELAKKYGMWMKSDVRPDYLTGMQKRKDYYDKFTPMHRSQLLDSILRDPDPIARADSLEVNLRDIAQKLGGVKGRFTNKEVQQLIQSVVEETIMPQSLSHVPPELQAQILQQYDPISAFERIMDIVNRGSR